MCGVKNQKQLSVLCIAALILLGAAGACAASSETVTVTVEPQSPGAPIPDDFAGISMETQILLPGKDGSYYFRPDNQALLDMFKFLDVKCLRIGGNTSDNPAVKVPAEADIDSLFAFARKANVKVIYGLRLRLPKTVEEKDKDAAYAELAKKDGQIAKYIMDRYRDNVMCFELGNEPNVYLKQYPQYKEVLTKFIAAIKAPDAAPDARICGPNAITGKGDWPRQIAMDFGKSGEISLITQHAYPGGNGRKVPTPEAGRDEMLSPKWVQGYQKMHDEFVPTLKELNLPYRIEETNSFYNGGAKDVSNTHAAALWGLDYLYWWATHDAAGLNFHTGDQVAAGDNPTPCWYALYWTSPQGYRVHPLGYAFKAFQISSHGKIVPAKVDAKEEMNLHAYAVLGDDKNLYVTIINKEHGDSARGATVSLNAGGFGKAEVMRLEAPDLAATDGEKLGGSSIGDNASWDGKWSPAEAAQIEVPAASAMVIRLAAQ